MGDIVYQLLCTNILLAMIMLASEVSIGLLHFIWPAAYIYIYLNITNNYITQYDVLKSGSSEDSIGPGAAGITL